MFADDIVICSESRHQLEENLERWRFTLEGRGMKVSCSKTEYVCERKGDQWSSQATRSRGVEGAGKVFRNNCLEQRRLWKRGEE